MPRHVNDEDDLSVLLRTLVAHALIASNCSMYGMMLSNIILRRVVLESGIRSMRAILVMFSQWRAFRPGLHMTAITGMCSWLTPQTYHRIITGMFYSSRFSLLYPCGMFGTLCLMMSVLALFIGLDVVSSVSICLVTLGAEVGPVDFYFIFINFMRVTVTVRVN